MGWGGLLDQGWVGDDFSSITWLEFRVGLGFNNSCLAPPQDYSVIYPMEYLHFILAFDFKDSPLSVYMSFSGEFA